MWYPMKHRFIRFLKCMATFQSLNIGLIKTLRIYNKHQIITDVSKEVQSNIKRINIHERTLNNISSKSKL